jgi:3-methyladenine DNA glycosylase/8-oxoguanine DNA glycosylase
MLLDPAVRRRAVAHLRRAEPVMAAIVRRVGPCRMPLHRGGTTYWYLTRAILRQQISGHAAAAIERRISERFEGALRPELVLQATDAELRALGLSRQKASYLRDLAAKANDGLPLGGLARMNEERVIETLTAVKGIGRWTAEMLLMFRLGRPDVLPTGDYGIRKAMQVAYRMRALPKPDRMRKIAEPWRPYRTIASWYLWRSLDSRA